MDGGDRAGYLQNAGMVDSVLITSTMGAASATGEPGWGEFYVLSSAAVFVGVTAAGLKNAALISSGTTYQQNAKFTCSKITVIEIATGLPAGKVIAHKRILL